MRLARKLTLALAASMMIVVAAHGWFGVRREIALIDAHAREDLSTMGRALRPMFAQVYALKGSNEALAMLRFADTRLQNVNVMWVPGATAPDAAEIFVPPDTAGWQSVRTPVHFQGVPEGAIVVARKVDQDRAFIAASVRNIIITHLAMIIIALVFTIAIHLWFIERPLRRIVAQARCVAAGDLDHRVEMRSGDEFDDVAAELNTMCDGLAAARAQLAAATEARIATLEQLRHADRLATVGRVSAGLAHQLGTPLNVVAARAKLISAGDDSAGDVATSTRIIGEQVERMAKIIRQLLDFSRTRKPRNVELDVVNVVERSLNLLAMPASRSGVVLELERSTGSTRTVADGDQLEQALTNLVHNGVLAMPSGGVLRVRLSRARLTPPADVGGAQRDFLRIDVVDNGAGIAAKDVAHVFEPFFTTREVGQGTGLGLSVAYGIAREHGGWIGVESQPGSGSTFSLFLPTLHAGKETQHAGRSAST